MLLKVALMLKYLLLFLSFANSNSNDSSVLYGEENGTDFVDAVGRLEFDMFLLRQSAVRLWHLRDGSTLTLLSESYFFWRGGWEKGWWSAESKCLPLLSIKSKLTKHYIWIEFVGSLLCSEGGEKEDIQFYLNSYYSNSVILMNFKIMLYQGTNTSHIK